METAGGEHPRKQFDRPTVAVANRPRYPGRAVVRCPGGLDYKRSHTCEVYSGSEAVNGTHLRSHIVVTSHHCHMPLSFFRFATSCEIPQKEEMAQVIRARKKYNAPQK